MIKPEQARILAYYLSANLAVDRGYTQVDVPGIGRLSDHEVRCQLQKLIVDLLAEGIVTNTAEEPKKEEFNPLGLTLRDRVTGMIGLATGHAKYLAGEEKILLERRINEETGVVPDAEWIDFKRLEDCDHARFTF